MSATSLRATGRLQVGDRRGCEGRIRSTLPLSYKRRNWTKSKGPVTAAPQTYDTVTQAFAAANQLTSTSTSGSSPAPATTYQYDADGQRTQSATQASGTCIATVCTTPARTVTYGYDQAGQLTSYADTATTGTNATYTYDATGLRKTQGTQTNPNTWDRSATLPQLLSDNTNAYVYGADGLPLESLGPNATVTVYHHDIQGSTRAITNLNGAAQATYSYDPYGALNGNVKTAATTNPFLYAGQYTDPTGLQYLRARYYDPATGQFLRRDPLETQTGQAYNYAADDPTDLSDPTGLCSLLGCLQSAGNAISQGAAGALDAITIGQSTRLAGRIFGFDPGCLDLGTAGQIGSNLAIGISFLDGEGEIALAAKAETRLLGPGTSFGTHVEDQLATRGWTKRLVQSTIDDPASTVATRDIRNLRGGGRMDDPATGYISRRGGYVVRNDRTGDIVQVSKRTDPGWKAPWDR